MQHCNVCSKRIPALEQELLAIEAAEAEAAAAQQSEPSVSAEEDSPEDDAVQADDADDPDEAIDDSEAVALTYADEVDEDDTLDTSDPFAVSHPQDENEPPLVSAPEHDDLADFDVGPAAPPSVSPPAPVGAADPIVADEPEPLTEEETAQLVLSPVPRINVHIFCVSERMTNLVEKAVADRRLAKAHVTLQHGDAAQAADIFASDATPNLIVLEAGDDPSALLNGLDALAPVCDPSTRVIVLGEINDIQLYRALMERGISDYLVNLRSPLQFISAISSLYADPTAAPIGKTYVFVGARGEQDHPRFATMLPGPWRRIWTPIPSLMDLDLAFGTAGLDFEHDPSQGLAEALSAPERLE